MNKGAISAVIATVLIILITVAAISILWIAVVPMIEKIVDINEPVSLEIVQEGYTSWDPINKLAEIQVKRGSDKANIEGFDFIFVLDGNSMTFPVRQDIGLNSKNVYYFNFSDIDGNLEMVKLVPVYQEGKKGDVVSILKINSFANKDLSGTGKTFVNPKDGTTTGGGEGTTPSCSSHASSSCYGGDVYWYDSCGNLDGLKQDCESEEVCSDDICEPEAATAVCGDGDCNGDETCSTCVDDCGECSYSMDCSTSDNCYYVSVSGAGNHNGSLGNEMTLDQAMNFANNLGGHTFWLSPGNYDVVTFNKGYGNATGGYNVYKANPLTTAPRDPNWYEEDIDRPSASNSVVFNQLTFYPYKNLDKSVSQFIEVDGINIFGGSIYFQCYVADVRVANLSLFGTVPSSSPYYSFQTKQWDYGINMPYQDAVNGVGSDYKNIVVDSSYIEATGPSSIYFAGNFNNIQIKNSHVRDNSMGPVYFGSGSYSNVVLENNHLEYQNAKADYSNYLNSVVSAVDPIFSKTKFNYSGSLDATHSDWVEITDANNNLKEIRKIISNNLSSREIIVDAPFSFDINVGDAIKFFDEVHGSCISFWGASNVILKDNKIHDCGKTAGINFYSPSGQNNISFIGNLIYDVHNQYTIVLEEYPPTNVRFENNTVVGYTHSLDKYGLPFMRNAGSYAAINNLFVGRAIVNEENIVENNIANSGNLEQDEGGTNKNNIVYDGIKSNPFDGSGNFFIGGANFEHAFEVLHGYNLNSAFYPMITSDACNGKINSKGVAVGALSCVCTSDAQCEEVFGSGNKCNINTRNCE